VLADEAQRRAFTQTYCEASRGAAGNVASLHARVQRFLLYKLRTHPVVT
jgi:hypothetical protein